MVALESTALRVCVCICVIVELAFTCVRGMWNRYYGSCPEKPFGYTTLRHPFAAKEPWRKSASRWTSSPSTVAAKGFTVDSILAMLLLVHQWSPSFSRSCRVASLRIHFIKFFFCSENIELLCRSRLLPRGNQFALIHWEKGILRRNGDGLLYLCKNYYRAKNIMSARWVSMRGYLEKSLRSFI